MGYLLNELVKSKPDYTKIAARLIQQEIVEDENPEDAIAREMEAFRSLLG